MMSLIRFIVVNMTAGFLIGLGVGFAFILSNGDADLLVREPLAAGMMLWGFAASFGMGALGTGLAMLPGE